MPRPKTVSDAEVLQAALEVLAAHGMNFTLSELAQRVGLSRATLIQRFGDRDAILLKMAEHEVELTREWLKSLPTDTSPGAAWRFLSLIVASMGAGKGFSVRVAMAALEAREPKMRVLAGERYRLVRAAIAERLPDGPHRDAVAENLQVIIAGATMHWVATDGAVNLSDYVLHRLKWAMEHLPANLTG